MTTLSVILAAGEQTRFPVDYPPKQLLRLPTGQTILSNTATLCADNGQLPAVWSHNKDITDWAVATGLRSIHPTPNERFCTAASAYNAMIRTQALTLLLGDVIYTGKAMRRILEDEPRDVTFFITEDLQEIVAVNFTPQADQAVALLRQTWEAAAAGLCEGKLWHFYRAMHGIPLIPARHEITDWSRTKVLPGVTDIDSPAEWENYLKTGRKNG